MASFSEDTAGELVQWMDGVLKQLIEWGLYTVAHKTAFFRKDIRWYGNFHSGKEIRHDVDRVQGVQDMRTPKMTGELQKVL